MTTPAVQSNPAAAALPSWNDGPAKQSILDFVKRVMTAGGADFVPAPDRIAVFDNDGTLWCEQPVIQRGRKPTRAVLTAVRLRSLGLPWRAVYVEAIAGFDGLPWHVQSVQKHNLRRAVYAWRHRRKLNDLMNQQ